MKKTLNYKTLSDHSQRSQATSRSNTLPSFPHFHPLQIPFLPPLFPPLHSLLLDWFSSKIETWGEVLTKSLTLSRTESGTGNTHTHTLFALSLYAIRYQLVCFTDFDMGVQAFVDKEESALTKPSPPSLALPWVSPSLYLELSISLKTVSQGQLTVSFLNCLSWFVF